MVWYLSQSSTGLEVGAPEFTTRVTRIQKLCVGCYWKVQNNPAIWYVSPIYILQFSYLFPPTGNDCNIIYCFKQCINMKLWNVSLKNSKKSLIRSQRNARTCTINLLIWKVSWLLIILSVHIFTARYCNTQNSNWVYFQMNFVQMKFV